MATIKLRRGTAAEWTAVQNSLVLASGEAGVETDTGQMKVGDGVSTWAELDYVGGGSGVGESTTIADSTSINLELSGTQITATATFGTTSGTVAEGNHTHGQLHDPVTISDSTSINLSLTGQALSADATFGTTAGTVAEGSHNHSGTFLQNYGEIEGTVSVNSNVATYDIANGNVQTLTLSGSNVTSWTFPSLPAAGKSLSFTLKILANGSNTVAWTGPTIEWITTDGSAPTLATTNGYVNVLTFISGNGRWLGFFAGKEMV